MAKSMKGIGMMISLLLIGLLGAIFISSIADQTTKVTTQLNVVNSTITAPAVNSTTNLIGKRINDFIVYNATGSTTDINGFNGTAPLPAGNFTITDVDDGSLTATYKTLDNGFVGSINVSYTTDPEGYVTSTGGRNLTNLLVILFAIGLLIGFVTMVINSENARRILGIGR